MDLRYKLFPYPILSNSSDDYLDSLFETAVESNLDGGFINFKINLKLINANLEVLLKQNKITFVIHIECSTTSFRKAIETTKNVLEYTIDTKYVSNKIQICTFIVSSQNLDNYENDKFNSIYKGLRFNIEKGCIIGIGDQVEIQIDSKNNLAFCPSIFSIVRHMEKTEQGILVDFQQNKILIKIPEDTFFIIRSLNKNIEIKNTINSIIIIPSLVYILEELSKMTEDELYDLTPFSWYITIREAFLKQYNFDLNTQDYKTLNYLKVAQQLINYPICKSINYLSCDFQDEDI